MVAVQHVTLTIDAYVPVETSEQTLTYLREAIEHEVNQALPDALDAQVSGWTHGGGEEW